MLNGEVTTDGVIQVGVVNSDGYITASFNYIKDALVCDENGDPIEENGNLVVKEGWQDSSGVYVAPGKIFFDAGVSFWVQAENGYSLQDSGKVCQDDIELILTEGINVVGNPFPTTLDLNDITIWKDGSISADGTTQVGVVDEKGYIIESFNYVKEALVCDENGDPIEENGDLVVKEGWQNSSGVYVASGKKSFEAGDGFWVDAKEGYTIRFSPQESIK